MSNKLHNILYADDTTLPSSLCSFTHGENGDINYVSCMINAELTKISDWPAVNKWSLNASKTKFMVCYNYQRTLSGNYIPQLMINNTIIEKVNEFNFLGLTINEFLNWRSHSAKIGSKISRTFGVITRLKRYLPFSAMKVMFDSLVISHLQFGISCWGFEWGRIFKLQKRALRIVTDGKYNAHTEPLFKELKLLKVKDIFNAQYLKFWYRFVNGTPPDYFRQMFTFNRDIYDIQTRIYDRLHLFPSRTSSGRNVMRHRIPELLYDFPPPLIERAKTHCIYAFVDHMKSYFIDMYND